MQNSNTERHFILLLLILVALLAFAIFYPFLSVIVLGASFAIILYPIFRWIKKHITKNISWLASTITIILSFIIIGIPIFFLIKTVVFQVQESYVNVISGTDTGAIINKIDLKINNILPEGINFNTREKIINIASSLTDNLATFFTYTFGTVIMAVLLVLTVFYMLNNGTQWKDLLASMLPLSKNNVNEIVAKLKEAVNRIFRGFFFVGLVQGFFAWVGFMIFNVPNALLWAVLASLASIIPTFGTSVITVPIMIYLVLIGQYFNAFLLLLWCILIIATVDNIISPYVISKNTDISPMFILFSVLGGIALFGAIGIIIGPLVISLLFCLVSIYKREAKLD
jgi:predicted PurR-regulated permease PerM